MRFEGKVALVTGGAQGIGRAAAAALVAEGAQVVLFDQDEVKVTATAKALGAIAAAGDISVRADVRRAVETCITQFGALDVLIANAGVTDAQPLLEVEDDRWQRALDVNVTGTFLCVQEAGRAMKERGGAM